MAATLFDHIKQITDVQNPKYWDSLEESDKKKWSNYMILRFLSMNPDWVAMIAQLQPYLQEIPPKAFYLTLIDLIPKSRTYLRYMKAQKEVEYEDWVVKLISKYYEVSEVEAEDYVHILYQTTSGKTHIKEIAEAYGTDPKQISKLKLKV